MQVATRVSIGKPRLRAEGFSQINLRMKRVCLVSTLVALVANLVAEVVLVCLESVVDIGCRDAGRFSSSLSASPQYGGLPSLATANRARKQGNISIADSPNFQRVHGCWGLRWGVC